MNSDFYGLRRVNPYLGVIQVIDLGVVRAYSSDGKRWQPRRVFDREYFGSVSEASHDCGFDLLPKDALMAAIEDRPAIPFPLGDHYELWLLHKDTAVPLALLKTCRWQREVEDTVKDPAWHAYVPSHGAAAQRHASLEDAVNAMARPRPRAQWFLRNSDGSGEGLGGLRVEDLQHRSLPPTSFPELLVDEALWTGSAEQSLLQDFHHDLAPLLLAHQGLSDATRNRLERASWAAPARLLDCYRMIPEVLDPDGLEVALVAAKLMRSGVAVG